MKYFPVANESEAQSLSSLIYDLTRPANSTTDTTKYALGWEFDINGACYLCVDEAFTLPVHADRGTAIETAVRGLQSQGKMSEASADSIINVAAANVGGVVTVAQVIPSEWLAIAVLDIVRPDPEIPGGGIQALEEE